MADTLLLRWPRSADEDFSWIVTDGRGAALSQPEAGPLALVAARAAGKRLIVLIPGSDVLLTQPEVPGKAQGVKLAQMVPYALEEQLAEDIDSLHFAVGRRVGDANAVPVAVVTRSLMDDWLGQLRAANLVPAALYADSDLLPENPGHAVALIEGDVVIVRPPVGAPISMPADALTEALELALPAQSTDEFGAQSGRGLVLYTGAAEWQQHSRTVESLRERFDGVKVQLLSTGPLGLFAQVLPGAHPIDLLQGTYVQENTQTGGWRAWRVAAILLGALLALHVLGKVAQLMVLKHSERTVTASMDEAFRAAMPGEQNTIDARRRMEKRLAAVHGGADNQGLLSALAALSQARNGAPGATVQALSFRNGSLDLKLSAPNAESLDHLAQGLRNQGWQADLTSGNAVGTKYEGRIQIHPGGAS